MYLERAAELVIQVCVLLIFWSAIPFIVLAGFPLARKVGIVSNWRAFFILSLPAVAAFDWTFDLITRILIPATLICLVTGTFRLAQPSVAACQIFGILFATYIWWILPFSFGFPFGETASRFDPLTKGTLRYFRFGGWMTMVGVWAYENPGQYAWGAAFTVFAYGIISARETLKALADYNYRTTPEVLAIIPKVEQSSLLFLQISDVHATFPKDTEPVGGGCAGNKELTRITQDIVEGRRIPRLLINTGDTVDRGRRDEWDLPMSCFRRIKSAGVRVVIAPGNHDLVPSYDLVDATWAVTRRRFLSPEMDGARLFQYLSNASELEPDLKTCRGEVLKDLVDREERRFKDLVAAWEDARLKADTLLGDKDLKPHEWAAARAHKWVLAAHKWAVDWAHRLALQRLKKQRPAEAETIAKDFSARACVLYPEWRESDWQRLLFDSTLQTMEWAIPYRLWQNRWAELFPLSIEIPEHEIEILILNTTAKNARLGGSARGECGKDQLERLQQRLSSNQARIVFILAHHAPFRFPQEPNEPVFQRWGMLAHDPSESSIFSRLLLDAATKGKQLLLLSGHIHMRSRCGRLDPTPADSRQPPPPVWVLECGALGEPSTNALPAGSLTAGGMVEPQLVATSTPIS